MLGVGVLVLLQLAHSVSVGSHWRGLWMGVSIVVGLYIMVVGVLWNVSHGELYRLDRPDRPDVDIFDRNRHIRALHYSRDGRASLKEACRPGDVRFLRWSYVFLLATVVVGLASASFVRT